MEVQQSQHLQEPQIYQLHVQNSEKIRIEQGEAELKDYCIQTLKAYKDACQIDYSPVEGLNHLNPGILVIQFASALYEFAEIWVFIPSLKKSDLLGYSFKEWMQKVSLDSPNLSNIYEKAYWELGQGNMKKALQHLECKLKGIQIYVQYQ